MNQKRRINSGLTLGINGFGRIGKLSLWQHVARKYFDCIVVNLGRKVGTSLADIAHYIERFGKKPLEMLEVNEFLTDQVNLGYKRSYWEDDFCHKIGLTREEYEKLAEEEGELEI